jgi:hypothetical protein
MLTSLLAKQHTHTGAQWYATVTKVVPVQIAVTPPCAEPPSALSYRALRFDDCGTLALPLAAAASAALLLRAIGINTPAVELRLGNS